MTHRMTRKQFGSTLLGGTVLLLVQACGGGGSDAYSQAPTPTPAPGGGAGISCSDSISDNHGHVLAIAAADLDSLADISYDIHGSAGHTHSLLLTAADLAKLKSHATVMATTSVTLAHSHVVTVSCV